MKVQVKMSTCVWMNLLAYLGDYSCQARSSLACDSWNNSDEDEVNHPVCDSILDKTSSKVHFEIKLFCFD